MADRSRVSGRRWATAIAVGALAIALSGAASGAALKERSEQLPPFESGDPFAQATPTCKQGQRAVAGGFFDQPAPPFNIALPLDSTREGKRGWRHGAGGNEAATATAYVYCDKDGPKLKTKSASAARSGDEDAPTELVARCRRGQEAVSGGFDLPETEALVITSKRTGKRSWTVSAIGGPGTYQVFAYCDKREPELKEKTKTITEEAVFEVQSVVAKCNRKQELRSGGFEVEFDEAAAYTVGSRRSGKRGWEASALPVSDGPELTAYAYCEKKKRK